MGHVLDTTLDQTLVQDASDSTGRSLSRLKLDADGWLEQVSIATVIERLQVVQHERAHFFVAQVKLACDPIPRRACGVIVRVLLLSFANVLVLPFATG